MEEFISVDVNYKTITNYPNRSYIPSLVFIDVQDITRI